MKAVYSSSSLTQCLLLKAIFESEGIECLLRNESLSNLSGELPPGQIWPELCILHDSDILKAEQILVERGGENN